MKKLLFALVLLSATAAHANPNFTIGSNPYFTFHAFPHDILRWPGRAAFSYMYPQTLPWQGHVTNMSERPNDTYISNYTYGIWDFNSLGRIYVELGTNRIDMELRAEGIVRNNSTLELIPIAARTDANRRYYDVQLIYANRLFGNPIGFSLQYQTKNMETPDSEIRFSRNGQEVISNHLTWGWTTTPCAHIFQTSSQNFDAWFLNDYTLYQGGQLDLQLSYEQGDHKSGVRYRRNRERGQNYYWQSSVADSVPGANFLGSYVTDSRYEDEIANDLFRAYSKIRFWKIGEADAGLLFFLQYADRAGKRAPQQRFGE